MTMFWISMLAIFLVGNVAGWVTVRGAGYRPWNWRVLVGPWTYYPWLDRQEAP